jgi:predicted dehydrogenase
MSIVRTRVGVIGCGDVAHRRYLPALAGLADRVEIVGCCDARSEAAERAADAVRAWSPGVRAFDRVGDLADLQPDAVFNLTPGPFHAEVTTQCLEAGSHVFSEKPLSSSVDEANTLIEAARSRGLFLLCAPGSAATRRVRWLAEVAASGAMGRPTLAVGQFAGFGPAGWDQYTGDPTPFYGPKVGPVFDLGIYRLHEMTAVLGPVRRVQAMGAIAVPVRTVVAGRLAGSTIEVTAPDHVLMNLEFASGALGQVLSSFAVASTEAPYLEVHFSGGSIALTGNAFDAPPAPHLHFLDAATADRASRLPRLEPDPLSIIETGAAHFVACVRGDEAPILTAEHARHVLDVVLRAYESIADGHSREIETTFQVA